MNAAVVRRPPSLSGKPMQQSSAVAVTASSVAGLASPGLMARQLSAAASAAASTAAPSVAAAGRGDDRLELSEEALWSDHEDSQEGAGSESEEDLDSEGEVPQRPASSGSSHEAALDSELKHSADEHLDAATEGLHAPAALRTALSMPQPPNLRRATATGIAGRRMHSSGYPDDDAAKLGTSVPIAIPLSFREVKVEEPDSPLQTGGFSIKAATFVPPHMLEASRSGAIDIANSVQGTSPSASLKRERLVNRNAILRRTGFLESSQGAAFLETMDPIRETTFEPSEAARASLSSSPASFSQPGALAKALEKAGIGSI